MENKEDKKEVEFNLLDLLSKLTQQIEINNLRLSELAKQIDYINDQNSYKNKT